MKIPEIKGKRNKIRNAAIVIAYKIENLTSKEISEKFELTQRRIIQILRENNSFIKRDKEWEKEKRIKRLESWLDRNDETKKDPADILDQLRKEIEGDKPLIDQSTHNNTVTYVWEDSTNKVQPTVLSTREFESSS